MPRRCTVCSHPDRAEIDLLLARHTTNVSQLARDRGVTLSAIKRHREAHVSSWLKVYGAEALLPTLGELHGEYLRLYTQALDNLATAERGSLVMLGKDEQGQPVLERKVSPTQVARAIAEARKTMDRIVLLASDAAEERERPVGVAQGELTQRVAAQLERLVVRSGGRQDAVAGAGETVTVEALPPGDGEGVGGGTPGGQAGRAGTASADVTPLDAVIVESNPQGVHSATPGLTPRARATITAHELSQPDLDAPVTDTTVFTVPNPRYDGSPSASTEERTQAGYPDIEVTVDDLRSNPDLVKELLLRRGITPPSGS